MKINIKKVLCISIMTVMLFSTMGIGAFAEVDQNGGGQETTVETDEQAEDQTAVDELQGEDGGESEDEPAWIPPEYLGNVANVKTLAGHQRVKVSWDRLEVEVPVKEEETTQTTPDTPSDKPSDTTPVDTTVSGGEASATAVGTGTTVTKEEVDRYIIKRSRNGGAYSVYCTVTVNEGGEATASGGVETVVKTATGYYIEDKDVGDGLIEYNGTWGRNGGTFRYKIIAEKDYPYPTTENPNGIITVSSNEKTAAAPSGACVRTSYVKLQLKTNKKLTSHDRKKITKTFKKNSTIYTCSFGVGQYMFSYNDHMFWLNRISTKKQSTGYTRSALYNESAEYFVNSRPYRSSKTNKLIWINTYTQRMYIFDKNPSTGKWVLNNSCKTGWAVSTGRSSAPTIRTIDPKSSNLDSGRKIGKIKNINKKIKKRHNIPYWNCFSSYNAIHGKKAKWSISSIPKSGGCVRNTNDHAKWVYDNCKNGTGVILF